MQMSGNLAESPVKRLGTFGLAVVLTSALSFPSLALAVVRVDETELAQGENAVGGGNATLTDSQLDMVDVTADELYADQDLSVNFNGGNDIENVNVSGSAEVDMSFSGENEFEEVHAYENSDVTINASGNNEFEEVSASDNADLTINVTGENEFEEITATDDANVTIQGTDCQKRDTIELGEGENDTAITTERGTLTIDHVTVDVEGREAVIGSEQGDVVIDTSKIAGGDDNEYISITAGGTMDVSESVVDITGTVHSTGRMTINHSDVKVEKPDAKYDDRPHRVYSETGIELIREENGEVKEGEIDGIGVFYVDTDDGDDVDLEADGDPAYYNCKGDADTEEVAAPRSGAAPQMGDMVGMGGIAAIVLASAAMAMFSMWRRSIRLQHCQHRRA